MLDEPELRTPTAPLMRAPPARRGTSVEPLVLPELGARELAAELDAVLRVRVHHGVVHELLALARARLVLAGAGARRAPAAEFPALFDEALVGLRRLEHHQHLGAAHAD